MVRKRIMRFIKSTALFSVFFVAAFAIPTSINVLAKVTSAQEKPKFEQLLKIENKEYKIEYDNSISMQPTGQISVRKIAYGKESTVNIITTSSGTYSSDSLTSRNVRYQGIFVQEIRKDPPKKNVVWILDKAWVATPVASANSFISIVRTAN